LPHLYRKEEAMMEDLAGTRAAAGLGQTYSTCEECGQVFLKRTSRPETAGLTDSAHSDYTDLCPECEALNRQGETTVMGEEL
jgi:hypothetical protein